MRLLAVLMAVLLVFTPVPAQADPTPVVVLTIGDSIAANGGMQAEFCRIVEAENDVVCDVRNEAVGATTCAYWPSRIAALMAQHEPDLVLFACGTNDDPAATAYGEPETSWAFRATVEQILPTPLVPTLIQYPDPLLPGAPQWLMDTVPVTNDRLWTQMQYYTFTGIADWQLVPSTATYLDTSGFHPTGRGYLYLGRLVYDAVYAGMGWVASSEPALCDLYGHRRGYTRPAYTPC